MEVLGRSKRGGAKIGGLNISAYAAAHGKLSFLYMSIDTLRIILHDFSSFPSLLSHVVAAAAVPETWQAKAASGAVSGAWGMVHSAGWRSHSMMTR